MKQFTGTTCALRYAEGQEVYLREEESMHGPFDKSPNGEPNIYQNWRMKLVALPLLLAIALIGYVISHPDVGRRVADGVQTGFAGTHRP